MTIAYIIFAHKSPDQLARLIHRLNTSGSVFFVHVNKLTDDITYQKMVGAVRNLKNVTFVKRHKITWGRLLFAVNIVISDIVKKKIEFDYMFLLTGQDYPIKTNDFIEEFLNRNKGKQFIHHFSIPRDPQRDPCEGWSWKNENGGLDRFENWHIRLFDKHYRIPGAGKANSKVKSNIQHLLLRFVPKRKFVVGFKPFGGSTYWCLTKECAEFMNDFIRDNPRFVNYFKYVGLPDEIFFQTIILNSPFRDSVINDDLRCTDWSAGGPHPRIWRKEDIEVLKDSKGLIARKFDSEVDSEILDLIDRKLLEVTPSAKDIEWLALQPPPIERAQLPVISSAEAELSETFRQNR